MSPVKNMPPATAGRLVQREQLSEREIEKMHGLLCEHFDGVTMEQFRSDIREKNWVVLVDRLEKLVGFSTILAYETTIAGQPCSVIYSGDTIVAPEAWNTPALPRAWIEAVAKLRERYPRGPYLWLLLTSGFRTYRFLPLFWKEFYPRFDRATPEKWRQVTDCLARERFGTQYDPVTGVVRFAHPQRLRSFLAAIPPGRTTDPHVAFFAQRNPGHLTGDELVCITELSPTNLTHAGRRTAASIPQW